MQDLDNKVAVVTGAASGIGQALAERFADEKMRLVLADIDESALNQVGEALRGAGCDVETRVCDVSQREQVEALAELAYGRFGAVHLLCNNAGVMTVGPAWTYTEADWQWVLGVNLWGTINGISCFVPRMLKAGEEGHIVNSSSIAGLITPPFTGAYSATKHALVGLSESLYHDLMKFNSKLSASVLCPGYVQSRIHESERCRPEALANPPGEVAPAIAMVRKGLSKLVEAAPPAATIVEAVVDAVLNRRFWILPHPELDEVIDRRREAMLAREDPPLPMMSPGMDGRPKAPKA